MCGYFGNLHECPAVVDLMNELNLPLPYPIERAYQRRSFSAVVSDTGLMGVENRYRLSPALWWYALRQERGQWVPNERVTSFNARDLTKPLWKGSMETSRALIFATELGESQGKDKFLMTSEIGFALGCLYKDYVNEDGVVRRAFAVVTREPHPRFSKFHHASTPLFLPLDASTLKEWLDPRVATSEVVSLLIDRPVLYSSFRVQKVKSYKHAEVLAEPEWLSADVKYTSVVHDKGVER